MKSTSVKYKMTSSTILKNSAKKFKKIKRNEVEG